MAKRQAILTFDSEDLQGQGSFVKIRMPAWGDIKKLRKTEAILAAEEKEAEGNAHAVADIADRRLALTEDLIVAHVVEWDWVDDEDNPLPRPKNSPEVLDQLTVTEIEFLAGAMGGNDEQEENRKNSPTS